MATGRGLRGVRVQTGRAYGRATISFCPAGLVLQSSALCWANCLKRESLGAGF